jgi:fructose-1,6-bisphosphatase/inositol monophosphatase family enzyme
MADARVSGWFTDDDPIGHRFRVSSMWVEPSDLDSILPVADGELDALLDTTAAEIWDRAPFIVLVEEAGGRHRALRGGLFTNGSIETALRAALLF